MCAPSPVASAARHRRGTRSGNAQDTPGVTASRFDLDDGRLAPELIELIMRTFRGVHLLTYLKRAELAARGKENDFERATEAGWDRAI